MKKIFWLIIVISCLVITGCSKKQYEVKFIGLNGEIIESFKLYKEDLVDYPEAPNIEGYDFIKWDKDIKNLSENTIITAIYKIKTYNVNFYDENDNLIETKVVEYNNSVYFNHLFSVEGYSFIGWDKDLSHITCDLDVKPLFSKKTFSVKFYDESDTLIKEEIVEYGSSATAPSDLTKEGHTFIGWDTDFTNVLANLVIYPVFESKKFTVNFYDESGKLLKEEVVDYGCAAEGITAPVKDGYKFARWDEDTNNVKSNLDVYPIYEELIYTVTFIDQYGDILKVEEVKYKQSATAPDAPTFDYYNFYKWDLDYSEVKSNMTVKAIYSKNQQSYSISNVNYWLQILSSKYNINKTILTPSEINSYNEKILSDYVKTEVMDVLSITGTKTQSYVKNLITAYSNINKYTVYNDSTKVSLTTSEKDTILSNRNLTNIPSTVTVKYGIISDFAWLRSYPTNHYSNNYGMDRFQETSLNVGEGVVVYHESADKQWYFVQAENYNGWIEKKYVAECSYDELESFLKPENSLLVISDYVTLESSHVRMGQVFPLVAKTDDSYTMKFPTRNSDGALVLKDLTVAKSNDYHEGYLDYTYYNVFNQAFKLLGIDYSWGDKDKLGRDCSSTMNAIYKCFGFMMPRNTTNQVAIPTYGSKVSGLTNATVQNYKPGSLIFTSSHVMLYLGENESGIAYLLHNTTSGNGECILQSLNDYGGSRINGVLKLQ